MTMTMTMTPSQSTQPSRCSLAPYARSWTTKRENRSDDIGLYLMETWIRVRFCSYAIIRVRNFLLRATQNVVDDKDIWYFVSDLDPPTNNLMQRGSGHDKDTFDLLASDASGNATISQLTCQTTKLKYQPQWILPYKSKCSNQTDVFASISQFTSATINQFTDGWSMPGVLQQIITL
jgi:hypothetical protein